MHVSSYLHFKIEAAEFKNKFQKRIIHRQEQKVARHLITFCKERSNNFPEVWIIVKYDAILMHADALQPKFAAESGDVVIVLHYVEHA